MKSKNLCAAVSWTAVITCMVIIFCLSHQTAGDSQSLSDRFAFLLKLPFGSFIVRKGAHFLEFAGLCTLVCNALYRSFGYFRPILSFALTAAYAASDEFHQLFIEGRACRVFDWFVDCSGALAALLALYIIAVIIRKKNRRSLR